MPSTSKAGGAKSRKRKRTFIRYASQTFQSTVCPLSPKPDLYLVQRHRPSFLHLRLRHSLTAQDEASEKMASAFIDGRPLNNGSGSAGGSGAESRVDSPVPGIAGGQQTPVIPMPADRVSSRFPPPRILECCGHLRVVEVACADAFPDRARTELSMISCRSSRRQGRRITSERSGRKDGREAKWRGGMTDGGLQRHVKRWREGARS